jgi:taurine dioxygenase
MAVTLRPMVGFGAEVDGLDVGTLTSTDRDTLRAGLAEHGILVVRGLELTPDEHVELTRVFGVPDIHPIGSIRLPGTPEIIDLRADAGTANGDDATGDEVVGDIRWHSDLTYVAEPTRGALLYAVVVPAVGGDTGFVDTVRVYAEMPEDLRRRIAGLEVVHSFGGRLVDLTGAPEFPPVTHPIQHRHPVTGQPALNVSPLFACGIVGWSDDDGRALLDELAEFATQDRFTYFHRWTPGDLVAWDNWRTMHIATGHPKRYARRMLRTTVRGGIRLEAA